MNCRRSEELWTDRLDATLPPPLESELRAHLDTCDACASLYEAFTEVVSTLEAIETPVPAEGLTAKILEHTRSALVKARLSRQDAPPTPAAEPSRWIRLAPAFAAAAVVALVLFLRPPDVLNDLSRQATRTAHDAYSFGVRTYHQTGRWLEDLNVLRITVSVAFEDRLDRLNERLRDLEEASRRRNEADSDESSFWPDIRQRAVNARDTQHPRSLT